MSPGDPRAIRSRTRIVAAARELLRGSGPESVTFAAVAERSGVGRATVYRHWPSVDALLDEVLDEYSLPYFLDPKQPIEPWLHGELRRLSDEMLFPAVVRMTTVLMQRDIAGSDERSKRRERLFGELERRLSELPVDAGADPALPAEEQAALLIGPLLYLALARGTAVRDTFIDHLIDTLVAP
jgi:AcrR family transcriptional regulator